MSNRAHRLNRLEALEANQRKPQPSPAFTAWVGSISDADLDLFCRWIEHDDLTPEQKEHLARVADAAPAGVWERGAA